MKPPKPLIVDGAIKGGTLSIPERDQLRAALRKWPDGQVEIEVRPHLETRRARANRYLFGVVYKMMAKENEQDVLDLHEQMKMRHNSKMVADLETGEEIRIAQSTAKLDIGAFSTYLERVMLDGNEYLGIIFPPPRTSEEWRDAKSI